VRVCSLMAVGGTLQSKRLVKQNRKLCHFVHLRTVAVQLVSCCLCLLISTKKKSNRTEPSSTSEVPTVPETKFFAVAPSLKSVFDNTDRPFSLFGSNTGACDQSVADDDDDGIDASDAKVSGKSLR